MTIEQLGVSTQFELIVADPLQTTPAPFLGALNTRKWARPMAPPPPRTGMVEADFDCAAARCEGVFLDSTRTGRAFASPTLSLDPKSAS